jgi:hypothetical protein
MFSKFASSSLSSSYNWIKKVDPTAIPDPKHSRRKDLNVGYPPFSEREPVTRRSYTASKKPFVIPQSAVVIDLCNIDSSITGQNSSSTKQSPSYPKYHHPDNMLSNSASRPNRNSKPRPHKRSKKEHQTREIIDLTVPSSLLAIREQNKVYFSYDPRGVSIDNVPDDYCQDCRCPKPYCADKVFGIHCNQYMERMIGRMGFDYYQRERDLLWDYHSHYVCMLEMKLSFNNIRVGNFSFDRDAELPSCVKQGSYKTFLDDLQLWKHGDSDSEARKIESVEFVDDEDIERGIPPLLKRKESDSDDDENEEVAKYNEDVKQRKEKVVNHRRTAVEQSSDIGATFKLMKNHLQKQKNYSKVVNPYKKK